jgi:ferredoxin-NADP reductase
MIRQDQSKKKLRLLAFGAGALFLLAAGGGVATYVSLNQRAEAQKIANDAAVKQAEAQAEAARKDYQTALANIDNLKKQLESATDEATRQKLQRQLDEATKKATAVRGASGTGGPRPTGPSAPAGAGKGKCAPGDPLCVE